MKERINIEDLATLKNSQKDSLRKFWLPNRYDIAIAYICTDVENDLYSELEFSVGAVRVHPNGKTILYDLHAVDGYYKIADEEATIEAEAEMEPIAYEKEHCLPLLDIGQMISILDQMKFSNFHFYILAGDGEIGCEVGNYNSILKDKILKEGYEEKPLCDVLWEMVKFYL